jgi:hypothetical protein
MTDSKREKERKAEAERVWKMKTDDLLVWLFGRDAADELKRVAGRMPKAKRPHDD